MLTGPLALNHNYLPSSDGGESVHCVIPIALLDILKKALRIPKGNIMLVSWIRLARQNLRWGYSRPWLPSLPPPLHLFIHLSHSRLIHVSLNPPLAACAMTCQKTTAATGTGPVKSTQTACRVQLKVSLKGDSEGEQLHCVLVDISTEICKNPSGDKCGHASVTRLH